MTDMLMLGLLALMTLAVLGLSLWSGKVVSEGSDDR
ncbi:hypothetical protein SAEN111111_08520 [Saccharibacillus endophyticus]|nr:hypothetical protein [Saccharibacillus endophyticus]